MDRIFIDDTLITGEDFRHVVKSQRHIAGDKLEVVLNGELYLTEISEVSKNSFSVKLLEKIEEDTNSIKIYLFQGYIPKKKMEHVFKMNGMLGVEKFIPTITERCYEKRIEDFSNDRCYSILKDSAEVSKSIKIPTISNNMEFKEAIEFSKTLDYSVILFEDENVNCIYDFLKDVDVTYPREVSIGIFVGPEGGFSEEEVVFAKDRGVKSIRLFRNILRTEYAAFSAISSILTYYERTKYES